MEISKELIDGLVVGIIIAALLFVIACQINWQKDVDKDC